MTIRDKQTADREQLHAVRFYEDDASLCRIAGGFLADGLELGLPAIAVTTDAHRDGIAQCLTDRGLDVERLQDSGHLVLLDANHELSGFMVEGMPDRALFQTAFTHVIRRACHGHRDCTVRAYGEMVDVLWKDGLHQAAIRLEMLWNELADTQNFSLLCGYSMGHFYKAGAFENICRQHTHVVSSAGEVAPAVSSSVSSLLIPPLTRIA
jgi:hypothetical protein